MYFLVYVSNTHSFLNTSKHSKKFVPVSFVNLQIFVQEIKKAATFNSSFSS